MRTRNRTFNPKK